VTGGALAGAARTPASRAQPPEPGPTTLTGRWPPGNRPGRPRAPDRRSWGPRRDGDDDGGARWPCGL